jgi:hypothetical protein
MVSDNASKTVSSLHKAGVATNETIAEKEPEVNTKITIHDSIQSSLCFALHTSAEATKLLSTSHVSCHVPFRLSFLK